MAAAAIWPDIKPELRPGSSVRNGGRPDRLASVSIARRRSERAPVSQIARAMMSAARSEEHTSELQSLMRISYAVFCLKKKNIISEHNQITYFISSKQLTECHHL